VPDGSENIVTLSTLIGAKAVAIETSESVTLYQSLNHNLLENRQGIPDDLPWGVINFRIETAYIGETIRLTIHFDEKAPADALLYKYDPENGWYDYSEHTQFSSNRKSAVIEIQDGGFGDIDGVANGVIVDPCGLGINLDTTSPSTASGSGSSDSGCFIRSINM
jgi:hypothetical protein